MKQRDVQTRSTNLRRQLLVAITPFLIAVGLFVLLAFNTTKTLSALRAYVQGESLWSKAQKQAVNHLERYAMAGQLAAFDAYRKEIEVTLGDRRARIELDQPHPNLAMVKQGFLAGRNSPDDVQDLIDLYQSFNDSPYLRRAIDLWSQADAQIDEIMKVAAILRGTFNSNKNAAQIAAIRTSALERLRNADAQLTPLEVHFSVAIGEASRHARRTLEVGVLILACVLVLVKLLISWWLLHQHVKIEQALRASEQRFDLAVRGSNDGIWNWAAGDDAAYLSPRAIELLGYPFEDFPRHPQAMLALVHKNDRAKVEAALASMISQNQALNVELRALDWNGNYRWVHVRGRTLRTDDNRIRVAGSVSDIRERKNSEALIRQMAIDEQRSVEQAQVAMLEQVQARIGRDLHDDLGQRLTGIAFLAKALEQRLYISTPAEREQTTWIVTLVNEAIDRVRFLSRQISPIEIDEISLANALRRLAQDIHNIFGTRIHLRITGSDDWIGAKDANHLFRIAQESINNALRHGHATRIAVRFDVARETLRLAIIDNGQGFDMYTNPKHGLGLRNMSIRANSLHGTLRIRSTKKGTAVIVRVGSPDIKQHSKSPEMMQPA